MKPNITTITFPVALDRLHRRFPGGAMDGDLYGAASGWQVALQPNLFP
jgi:hypothetical protein